MSALAELWDRLRARAPWGDGALSAGRAAEDHGDRPVRYWLGRALEPAFGPGWPAVGGWLAAIGTVLLANAVVFAAVTRPAWAEVAERTGRTERLQQAVQTLEPALERARRQYGAVLEAEGDLEELRDHIGRSSRSVAQLVGEVQQVVESAGMTADRISYQTTVIEDLGMVQLQASLPVRGSYESVRQLVEGITRSQSFLVLERIGVASPDRVRGGSRLEIGVLVSGFLLPEALSSISGEVEVDLRAGASEGSAAAVSEAANAGGGADRQQRPVAVDTVVATAEALRRELERLPPVPLGPEELDIDTERLRREANAAGPAERNLFAFAGALARPQRPRPEPAEVAEAVPPEPALPVRLVGIILLDGRRYASLADGDRIFVAAAGSGLDNGVQVLDVGTDFAEVMHAGRQTRLRLEEPGR